MTAEFGTFPADLEVRPAKRSEVAQLVQVDDEACALYEAAGMSFTFPSDHPFIVEERARWSEAVERGWSWVVVTKAGAVVAFAVVGRVDERPYLDQLSVHPGFMRRGLGRALVGLCVEWASGQDVWLTTYSHLPWNAPFYEQLGFAVVPEHSAGPDLRRLLESQRALLPEPERRTIMRRPSTPTDPVERARG